MNTKNKQIRKITLIGFFANILLSIAKILAGTYGKSQAVLADGIHSLSDTTTDIAIIVGSYFWSKPPDSNHPYGHQRIETIVSIFIGIVLLAAGAGIGMESIFSLHENQSSHPGVIPLAISFISIVCKESLYQLTMITGKKIKSISLTANAWHHRIDAISSIPVFIAVAVSILWPSWDFIDLVGAIFVSFLIGYAALGIIFKGLKELIDVSAPVEMRERIKKIAMQNSSVQDIHAIRTRYVGSSLQVDLHAVVDGSMTVFEGHQIAEDIEKRILDTGPNVVDVIVHIEPGSSLLF
jgi:cation diffusion facilitator family transporter